MTTQKLRRRLTVGQVDAPEADGGGVSVSSAQVQELLQVCKGTALADVVQPDRGGSKWVALHSETDKNRNRRQSFADKDERCCGAAGAAGSHAAIRSQIKDLGLGIGVVCKKGLKPESPNQDSFCFIFVEEKFKLYGVFDGHGPQGHDVSNFCQDAIVKLFLRHPDRDRDPGGVFRTVFNQCQEMLVKLTDTKEIDSSMSGSTCTMVFQPIVEKGQPCIMTVAYTGDSRCVLGRMSDKEKKFEVVFETEDHKPNLPKERERIIKAGGRVVFDGYFNHRVFTKEGRGGLNMSRALGDNIAHRAGVSSDPEVHQIEMDSSKQEVLLIASDGVWEFIQNDEALQIASKYNKSTAQDAAEELSSKSWDAWITDSDGEVADDITCFAVFL